MIANPHSSAWAATAIAIEAGVLLAAAYVLTRRLWLVMGIHFAWNFTQGGIFGVAVSGGHASGLLASALSGPTVISGGELGAEASVFAVAICLAAGLVSAWRAHALGHFTRPVWRRVG
jgi:CAAX protease family protein